MASVVLEGQAPAGTDGYPPSLPKGPYTTTAFFNGKPIQLRGVTEYTGHGPVKHGEGRKIVDKASTFFMEGSGVAITGDEIDCGDLTGPGSTDTFVTH